MQEKNKGLLKNISYSFTANLISTLAGVLSVLIIPKFIGTDLYVYYQLYIFFAGYITITALGWADGTYLRIGGKEYSSLNRQNQSTQFWMLSGSQIILFLILFMLSLRIPEPDFNRRLVYLLTCVCAMIVHARYYLQLVLQATNRIKEYSIIIIIERLVSTLLSIVLLMSGYRGYVQLIVLDIIGRFLSLVLGAYYCRDFVFHFPHPNLAALRQMRDNIFVGWMVLFSSLAGNLVIGVLRSGILEHWSLAEFNKVSLTISISNMALRCINAIGIVMFPALRRMDKDRLPEIYHALNAYLMLLIFGALVFYYPAAQLLKLWLPAYADSVRYAAILMPICVYECKNAMLVSTYLKTIRQEGALFIINASAILISFILMLFSVYLLDSIELAVLSMLIVLMFRCVAGEWYVGRVLKIKMPHIIPETILVLLFILCNWYLDFSGMWIYLFCYIVYLVVNRRWIRSIAQRFTAKP